MEMDKESEGGPLARTELSDVDSNLWDLTTQKRNEQ